MQLYQKKYIQLFRASLSGGGLDFSILHRRVDVMKSCAINNRKVLQIKCSMDVTVMSTAIYKFSQVSVNENTMKKYH